MRPPSDKAIVNEPTKLLATSVNTAATSYFTAAAAAAHSITAAFMITTMVARPGSLPMQRTECGRSQR